MKFTPCQNQCDQTGTHCSGCGRSHEEIKATLALVRTVSEHMLAMNYQNPQEFVDLLAQKSLKRLGREQAKLNQTKVNQNKVNIVAAKGAL